MNELDFDKLLSIEDPIPAAKPKPEPPAPTPPDPEVPTKPETKPKLHLAQQVKAVICLAVLLVLGIAFGIWWRQQNQTDVTLPPAVSDPAITPPQLQLAGSIVYEDAPRSSEKDTRPFY